MLVCVRVSCPPFLLPSPPLPHSPRNPASCHPDTAKVAVLTVTDMDVHGTGGGAGESSSFASITAGGGGGGSTYSGNTNSATPLVCNTSAFSQSGSGSGGLFDRAPCSVGTGGFRGGLNSSAAPIFGGGGGGAAAVGFDADAGGSGGAGKQWTANGRFYGGGGAT